MTDFLDQYATQFRAAAETRSRRGHRLRRAVPAAALALLAAGAGAALLDREPGPPPDEVEQTARPVPGGGWAEQRSLLGVLRDPRPEDRDAQVRRTMREYRELGPRAGRLLGKAPSGSAYVLLATRRHHVTRVRDGVPVTRRAPDGLCLVRRGTRGGAGACRGTAALRAGEFHGALAGQAYGLVPDGVTHVRPPRRDELVAVRRNFYAYPAGNDIGPPAWLDAQGEEVATVPPPGHLAFINVGGHVRLSDIRRHVLVLVLWASWCAPCEEQMRSVQRIHRRLSEQRGAEVIAVATRDAIGDARAAIERLRTDLPVLHDPRGSVARQYGAKAFPHTLVLSPAGKVVAEHRGVASAAEIEDSVRRAR